MKYVFRNVVVFDFDPDTGIIETPHDKLPTGNFNYCRFIDEDYKLMGEFFNDIYRFKTGEIKKENLKDIKV